MANGTDFPKSYSRFTMADLKKLGIRLVARTGVFAAAAAVEPSQWLSDYLNADAPIFTRDPESPQIETPVFFVTEAKNENLESGVAQCLAEMYAAQLFNEAAGIRDRPVFGVVTYGREWQFYRLDGKVALQDKDVYSLKELGRVLGVLQFFVEGGGGA